MRADHLSLAVSPGTVDDVVDIFIKPRQQAQRQARLGQGRVYNEANKLTFSRSLTLHYSPLPSFPLCLLPDDSLSRGDRSPQSKSAAKPCCQHLLTKLQHDSEPQLRVSNKIFHSRQVQDFIIFVWTSSSAIAERPRCRVGQFWQKVEDWNWETIFCRHYRSMFNHCDVTGQQSYQFRWKKTQKRAIMSFKVIQSYQGWC